MNLVESQVVNFLNSAKRISYKRFISYAWTKNNVWCRYISA